MTTTEPGPMSSVGERFNPLSEEQLEDPYSFYAEARREEPVFCSPAFRMWVVTRYSDARAVLGNPTVFSSRKTIDPIVKIATEAYGVLASGPPVPPVLVNSDPPDHGRFRRVLNRAFSPPRMRLLEPAIREITDAHVDAIEPLGRADVMQALAFPIPVHVIARLLDVGDEHAEQRGRWGRSLIALISSAMDTEQQVAAATEVVNLQRFMADLVRRKRTEPGDDVASQMLAAGEFTEDELVFQMTGLHPLVRGGGAGAVGGSGGPRNPRLPATEPPAGTRPAAASLPATHLPRLREPRRGVGLTVRTTVRAPGLDPRCGRPPPRHRWAGERDRGRA